MWAKYHLVLHLEVVLRKKHLQCLKFDYLFQRFLKSVLVKILSGCIAYKNLPPSVSLIILILLKTKKETCLY